MTASSCWTGSAANGYFAAIPSIVVSGRDVYGILGNKERALKAGAKAFVQKPWDDAELLATISELLGQPEASIPQV